MGSSCHLFFHTNLIFKVSERNRLVLWSVCTGQWFMGIVIDQISQTQTSMVLLSQDWHSTQTHSLWLFRTLAFVWPEKLLEPCSEQSSQAHYFWLGNRSPLTFIPYLLHFLWCGSWSYIAPFPSTLNSSFSSLSYPRFLHLHKHLQRPHICHYSYLYSRLFWRRVAGFRSGRGHSASHL